METVVSILKKTTDFLARKGVESARLNAELLIAEALNMKRLDVYMNFDRPLEAATVDQLRTWVKRRAEREPLQYITGQVDFLDLKLKVDSRVLIPRPETEHLCSIILESCSKEEALSVLDLGTGSGAILLGLLSQLPQATGVGVDVSEGALALAGANGESNKLSERVSWVQSSWLDGVEGVFDVIVSNPPYLTEAEWRDAEPEVKDHEPLGALVADNEGLSDIEAILSGAQKHLKPGGVLYLETGIAQHALIKKMADNFGYTVFESLQDLTGRDRFCVLKA